MMNTLDNPRIDPWSAWRIIEERKKDQHGDRGDHGAGPQFEQDKDKKGGEL